MATAESRETGRVLLAEQVPASRGAGCVRAAQAPAPEPRRPRPAPSQAQLSRSQQEGAALPGAWPGPAGAGEGGQQPLSPPAKGSLGARLRGGAIQGSSRSAPPLSSCETRPFRGAPPGPSARPGRTASWPPAHPRAPGSRAWLRAPCRRRAKGERRPTARRALPFRGPPSCRRLLLVLPAPPPRGVTRRIPAAQEAPPARQRRSAARRPRQAPPARAGGGTDDGARAPPGGRFGQGGLREAPRKGSGGRAEPSAGGAQLRGAGGGRRPIRVGWGEGAQDPSRAGRGKARSAALPQSVTHSVPEAMASGLGVSGVDRRLGPGVALSVNRCLPLAGFPLTDQRRLIGSDAPPGALGLTLPSNR